MHVVAEEHLSQSGIIPHLNSICHSWMCSSVGLNPFRKLSRCLMLNRWALSLKSKQLQLNVHPCSTAAWVGELVSDGSERPGHTADCPFPPRHSELALDFSWIIFSHSYLCMNWFPGTQILPATDLVQLLCMGSPKEVRCPAAFQHLSSPTGTKRWFSCLGKLQPKNDMRADRRILTAEGEQDWKLYFPAWQTAGSGHCNLPPVTFHRLWGGERSWGARITQCVFTVIYLSSVRIARTPSVTGFSTILQFYFTGSFSHLAQGRGACSIQGVQQTRQSTGQT